MNKKIYVILIICLIAFIKMLVVINSDNNVYYEDKKEIIGKITYIKKDNEKIIFDIKSKQKYRITTYDDFNYGLGDYIKIKGLFYTPNNNTVFNTFNYRKYLLSLGIKEISNDIDSVTLVKKNKNIFYSFKNMLIKNIGNLKSKDYINAFILGDTSFIKENIKDAYTNLGISHLFSVSGMHVGFIILVLNKLLRKIKHKNLIIYLILFLLVFMTNFQISILRCILFLILNKLNSYFKLNINAIYIITLTAFMLLLFNSYLIYNIGFLFSIIITFFIILSNNFYKNKSYLKKIFFVSLISFLASIPILAYNFYSVNFLSIVLNLIFVPLVSFIMFPFSFITLIMPYLDNVYVYLIDIFESIILFFYNFKFLNFTISKPNLIIIFLYYLFLFLTIKVNKKYIILYLIILVLNLLSNYFIFDKQIVFLDVSQGDSSILIMPGGRTILIDTGGLYNRNYSIVKNKIKPFLNSKGIDKIDVLITTHGDYDHMGEVINLVNNFKVEKVILNCGEFNELEQDLIKVLDKKKIPYYSCIKELSIDKNKLYFFQTKEYDNENDNSNVIYTELNGYKFMFMGDASVTTEKEILDKYNLPNIDVLKVGHHGSKTSSSKYFINKINPKYSIISVGKNNRYGHPNDSVLENLNSSKIYRTDQDGSIMIKIKNNKLNVETSAP